MAGALGRRSSALVVDLCGSDMAVAEEVFDLHNIHIGVEQEGSGSRPQRMRRVDAPPNGCAIRKLLLLHGAGEQFQVVLQE